LNLKELKEILQILDDKEIAEFELEEQGMRLRIRRAANVSSNHNEPAALPAPVPASAAPPRQASAMAEPPAAQPAAAPQARAEEDPDLSVLKSPIVGTFYRGPDPASPPFVNVGDRVRVGQVLCIIEAMKLMNEIEAEVAGEVVAIHHENGQPVQYGEPLFGIRKER
jgi:acetyl-CoA carboxylase biotin carboxyl carrier protein